MKKIMLKKIAAFAMAAVMVLASLAIPSVQAEASSEKSVKNVKLKIGSETVTNKKYTMTDGSSKTLNACFCDEGRNIQIRQDKGCDS